MGNDNSELLSTIDGLTAGRLAGPLIFRNGLLEGRSPYSARVGMIADTLEQALADVQWYAGHGYFEVKIYNSLPPDWVALVAAEAHRLGMGVTGHVPAFSSPDRVIREGYNSIAHVNQLMLGWMLKPDEDTRTALRLTAMARAKDLDLDSTRVRETIDLMKTHHVALDTTAVALEQLMLSRAREVEPGDRAFLDHMPIDFQRYRRRSFVTINSRSDDAAYKAGFEKLLEVLHLLDREGIQLLPGTDDVNGFGVPRELELYVAAGIPPGRALRLATLDAERYLHHENQGGSIERGKSADFILVAADPVADIHNIRRVRMTVRGGVVYFPSEIYTNVAVRPFESSPTLEPAAERGAKTFH
jgi:imidazolonepropionase-like amidohydrolase